MTSLFKDLSGGVRQIVKAPTQAAATVLTVSLVIAGLTAVFTIVHAVLLRPLPFRAPEQIVEVIADVPRQSRTNITISVPEVEDLSSRTDIFEHLTAIWVFDATLTGIRRPERVVMLAGDTNYFEIFPVQPQLGRVFGHQDRAAGFADAIVISDGAWRRWFDADPATIGRQIRVDGDARTIVGILPKGFRHPAKQPAPDVDIWSHAGFRAAPFPPNPGRRLRFLPTTLARLKDGVSLQTAAVALRSHVDAMVAAHPQEYPPERQLAFRVVPMQEVVVGNSSRSMLGFAAAAGLLWLIACANIASLLFARASARHTEIAVRYALGARRRAILWQLLSENVVVCGLGGVLGIAVTALSQPLLIAVLPQDVPRLQELRIDWVVVGFAAIASTATAFACTIGSAWYASRPGAMSAAVSARTIAGGRRQRRFQSALVVAEVAVAVILVTTAGLLAASVSRLLEVDPGFTAEQVTAARTWVATPTDLSKDAYQSPQARATLVRRLVDEMRQMPTATVAAVATAIPLGHAPARFVGHVDDTAPEPDYVNLDYISATPDYFSLLNIPLIKGRVFTDFDTQGSDMLAVIDDVAERRMFPNGDSIGRKIYGQRLTATSPRVTYTVVGVVRTVRDYRLDEAERPHFYTPLYQRLNRNLVLLAKGRQGAQVSADDLRAAVARVDPDLPVFTVDPLETTLVRSIERQQFSARALAAIALLAALLATAGVYGLTANAVSLRQRETAVRIAIGARPAEVIAATMRDTIRTVAAGTAIGLLLAAVAAQLVRSMLFNVNTFEPQVFAYASVALVAAAVLGALVPASRAARVSPVELLRADV